MQITIVGAGICGLTTGLTVQRQFPSADVTIVANKFEEDTLSAGAAGIFRPGGGLRSSKYDVGKWISCSYKFYEEILYSASAQKAGVMKVGGYLFSSKGEGVVRNAHLEKCLPVYRRVTEDELTSICCGNFKYGSYFETLITESTNFLPWAGQIFLDNGGIFLKKEISCLGDVEGDWIINCTGLGAKWLCGDDRVVPIRGQVFKVIAPWVKMFYYGDYDTYIIPNSRTITLGGTRNFDSYNENVDHYDSQAIWDRCTRLLPNLKGAQVVREWVGLRPYRDEVRVEFEIGKNNQKIIHNYGHGGYGITSAPGTAMEVANILREEMRMRSSRL